MYVSARADYALRALMAMARAGRPMTALEMATQQGLPPRYLGVVLLQLRRSGVVVARRGRHAGYRFAADPATVTAADVVRAVDGLLAEVPAGGSVVGGRTPADLPCLVDLWSAVHDSVEKVLESVTIADLTMPGRPAGLL